MLQNFQLKLELWETKVKNGNVDMSETLADKQDTTVVQMVSLTVEYLSSLQNEIKRYFPGVSKRHLKLIRLMILFQKIILNLSMTALLVIYLSLVRFWCKIRVYKSYLRIADKPFRSVLLSPSSYLFETGFSILLVIKSELRYRLYVKADLRYSLAKIAPRLSVSAISLTRFAAEWLNNLEHLLHSHN